MAKVDSKGLVLLTIGGVIAYSGVRGKSIGSTARSFLKGQSPASAVQSTGVSMDLSGNPDEAVTSGTINNPGNLTGSAVANRGIGRILAVQYGWTGVEFSALDSLWTRESGWNNYADNPSSHAYGIPQALPASKLPHAGQPASLGGSSSAVSQIAWGLAYIKAVYGAPSAAWQHELANSWY